MIYRTSLHILGLCAALMAGCGDGTPKFTSRVLFDDSTTLEIDRDCSMVVLLPYAKDPTNLDFACRGVMRPNDERFIYFELLPLQRNRARAPGFREEVMLQLNIDSSAFREYRGISLSGRVEVRISIPTGNKDPDAITITLLQSTAPYSEDAPPPGTRRAPYCNDSKTFNPSLYRIPLGGNRPAYVSQAAGGSFSHQNSEDELYDCVAINHAFDFTGSVGSAIHAAREGTVHAVKSDSNVGGPSPAYANAANFIGIKHDDGTVAYYLHLRFRSIRVREGQKVKRGQVIAQMGMTGFTTGPHLHFEVRTDDDRYTVPALFATKEHPLGETLHAFQSYGIYSR